MSAQLRGGAIVEAFPDARYVCAASSLSVGCIVVVLQQCRTHGVLLLCPLWF